MAEHLVEVFADVLAVAAEKEDAAKTMGAIAEVLEREGGTAKLAEQCEQVSAHHGDRYQPFVWKFYSSHLRALFRVIKTRNYSEGWRRRLILSICSEAHDSVELKGKRVCTICLFYVPLLNSYQNR